MKQSMKIIVFVGVLASILLFGCVRGGVALRATNGELQLRVDWQGRATGTNAAVVDPVE